MTTLRYLGAAATLLGALHLAPSTIDARVRKPPRGEPAARGKSEAPEVSGTVRGADETDARPCKSIRPGLFKGIAMMLAEGGDERRRNDGPIVPVRSDAENRARVEHFWTSGVRPNGSNAQGALTYLRGVDGARIVLIPGADVELGVPERLRDKVPPVVVKTSCPAHVINLVPGVGMQADMVLRVPDPAHRATVRSFAIDETEVTWARYRRYQRSVLKRERPEPERWGEDDHPVTHVTWYEAAGYCDWVGGRLPTDAEWEYAARGPAGYAYTWGDEWPPPEGAGNFYDASLAKALCESPAGLADDSYVYTSPVGSFPKGASPFGVLDMLGNAAEWVSDWGEDVDLTVQPVAEPCPPSRSDNRGKVERGNCFFESSILQKESDWAWERGGDVPWARYRTRGFRCAHDGPTTAGDASP